MMDRFLYMCIDEPKLQECCLLFLASRYRFEALSSDVELVDSLAVRLTRVVEVMLCRQTNHP